jgi:hypothetical protein
LTVAFISLLFELPAVVETVPLEKSKKWDATCLWMSSGGKVNLFLSAARGPRSGGWGNERRQTRSEGTPGARVVIRATARGNHDAWDCREGLRHGCALIIQFMKRPVFRRVGRREELDCASELHAREGVCGFQATPTPPRAPAERAGRSRLAREKKGSGSYGLIHLDETTMRCTEARDLELVLA